ncbi:MAG: hypothetical protein H8M99_05125 [Gloeobacteraceae cyanobacterium ES-bin-144]|nr:hypothetical protein [Verrucomicrobiales bacterium]
MKPHQKNNIMLILAAAMMALISVSCNTVNGVGRDVERTGDHIKAASR